MNYGKSKHWNTGNRVYTEDAMEMKQVADETELLLMERFHNLYHPISRRIKEIFDSQELGTVQQKDFTKT